MATWGTGMKSLGEPETRDKCVGAFAPLGNLLKRDLRKAGRLNEHEQIEDEQFLGKTLIVSGRGQQQ